MDDDGWIVRNDGITVYYMLYISYMIFYIYIYIYIIYNTYIYIYYIIYYIIHIDISSQSKKMMLMIIDSWGFPGTRRESYSFAVMVFGFLGWQPGELASWELLVLGEGVERF